MCIYFFLIISLKIAKPKIPIKVLGTNTKKIKYDNSNESLSSIPSVHERDTDAECTKPYKNHFYNLRTLRVVWF